MRGCPDCMAARSQNGQFKRLRCCPLSLRKCKRSAIREGSNACNTCSLQGASGGRYSWRAPSMMTSCEASPCVECIIVVLVLHASDRRRLSTSRPPFHYVIVFLCGFSGPEWTNLAGRPVRPLCDQLGRTPNSLAGTHRFYGGAARGLCCCLHINCFRPPPRGLPAHQTACCRFLSGAQLASLGGVPP